MAKRQTIGDNHLEGLFQPIGSHNGDSAAVLDQREEQQAPQKKAKQVKQRITVQISEDVIDRIKNAAYWTPGLTLASLAEEAFSRAVDVLENERGAPFPKRKEELKTGRPIS